MRGARIALAALVVAAVGIGTALVSRAEAGDPAKRVRRAVARTQNLVAHAWKAVKAGGEAKDDYRSAWIRQEAAHAAQRGDKRALALALTLRARPLARHVIQANGDTLSEDEAKEDAGESDDASAGGPGEDEIAEAIRKVEETTPPPDELIASNEPKTATVEEE